MSLSPFDVVSNLFKKDNYLSDEELQGYSQWMVNKILSCDQKCVIYADALNRPMTDRMHYDFLYHALPKVEKKFIKYLCKKQTTEQLIKYIMQFYSVNSAIAKLYSELLSKEELQTVIDFFEKRGVTKK